MSELLVLASLVAAALALWALTCCWPTYKFVSMRPWRGWDYMLTVERQPHWLMRWFGAKPCELEFYGHGSWWCEWPSCRSIWSDNSPSRGALTRLARWALMHGHVEDAPDE